MDHRPSQPPSQPLDKQKIVDEIGCNCQSEKIRGDALGPLQRQLASSYYWSGSCSKDYGFFIVNWHPLLGMFMSHPAHPWTKVDRIATFFFSCSLSLLPISLKMHSESKDEGDDRHAMNIVFIFVGVTVPIIIWEVILYWIAIMHTYCIGRDGICCGIFGALARCFKACCMSISLLLSLSCAGVSSYIAARSDVPFILLIQGLIVSRFMSWFLWFPIWTFIPFFGFVATWRAEQRKLRAKQECLSMKEARIDTAGSPADHIAIVCEEITCATPGCSRRPWNRRVGETCCRSCASSCGTQHGEQCEQRLRQTFEQAQDQRRSLDPIVVGGRRASARE